jgi:ribosomal protein L7Ae-like RNA K-turn-binding protein
MTKDELGNAIGKPFAACIGITDANLSELISRNL